MPPVSEKQRRAMGAAKAGKSTLGIPKSVGADFISSDPGGKLPASAKSSKAEERKEGDPRRDSPREDRKEGMSAMIARQKGRRGAP